MKMIMLIMKSRDYISPPAPVSKCWLQKMAQKAPQNKNVRTTHIIFATNIFSVTLSTILKQLVLL